MKVLAHNKSNTYYELHPKKILPEIDNIELLNHQMVSYQKRDLLNFGNALPIEIQSGKPATEQPAQWLKSSEVRKLLKISGTFTKPSHKRNLKLQPIGGILITNNEDIWKKLMEK
jgi:hypothetical protein